jgi:hypothetical protein
MKKFFNLLYLNENKDACIFFGKLKVLHYFFIFFIYTQIGCGGKGRIGGGAIGVESIHLGEK